MKEVISRFSQTADEDLKEIASRFEKRLFQLFDIIDLRKSVRVSTRDYRPNRAEDLATIIKKHVTFSASPVRGPLAKSSTAKINL
ncbi:hypothetical protein BaRGS_00033034 [Batillaria attramentaria]|uniref:Uncharacterized protein n=1 Tax=Batillaria attramentaria TaxID=370345 RepID=A0ABD0JMJ7_9CAEN